MSKKLWTTKRQDKCSHALSRIQYTVAEIEDYNPTLFVKVKKALSALQTEIISSIQAESLLRDEATLKRRLSADELKHCPSGAGGREDEHRG